jgi:integrase/recombinase XerD
MNTEINYSPSYGIATIGTLYRFSKYHKNKPFKEVTRDDIINYLNTVRKTDTQDPLHQWVASYNHYMIILLRFFKWLYSPDLHHGKRPAPAMMENIDKLKRDEVSIYKPAEEVTIKVSRVLWAKC